MIYEISNSSLVHHSECIALVGEPFSFHEKVARGCIGSPNLLLISFSSAFGKLHPGQELNNLVDIEIRPKGVIVHFDIHLLTYAWVIPFYKLHTYQSSNLSIHADGHFMKFSNSYLGENGIPFFKKLHQLKVDSMPPDSGYFDY